MIIFCIMLGVLTSYVLASDQQLPRHIKSHDIIEQMFNAVPGGNCEQIKALLLSEHLHISQAQKQMTALTLAQHHRTGAHSVANILPQESYREISLWLNIYHAVDIKDRMGLSILHWAACNEYLSIAHLLVNLKANVNNLNNQKNTPLHLAVLARNKEIVQLLLDADADCTLQNKDGCTPLQLAEGENGITRLIKQHLKTYKNSADKRSPSNWCLLQ